MENGAVYYAKHQNAYVFKLTGEVRYQLGCAFDDFLKLLFAREDFTDIVIDLTETSMIDSTNLGLLAKIANYIQNRFNKKVTVFSTNEDVNKILESVGFFSVFDICKTKASEMCGADQAIPCDTGMSHLARTLYDSHLILSELNEKNREMFKSVIEELQTKVCSG